MLFFINPYEILLYRWKCCPRFWCQMEKHEKDRINKDCKLGLAQMVRFFVVESAHLSLNFRFNVSVTYLRLIILSMVGDVPVDSESLFDRLRESQES
jgi:hypothetical protein